MRKFYIIINTIGFRASEIKPEGVFSLIRLQNGDILQRINDYEAHYLKKGWQILRRLRGGSNLTVNIIRNGQPNHLRYQIRCLYNRNV